jgi:hypothetical protein
MTGREIRTGCADPAHINAHTRLEVLVVWYGFHFAESDLPYVLTT